MVMRDLAILFIHLLVTIARLLGPGGVRSVVAESLLVKHQLVVLNRSRARVPSLRPMDRIIVGLCAIWMRPSRLLRSAIVLKPSTLLSFHRALVKRKYRFLFTPKTRGKPGPKGPSAELISLIVEMKRRNPNFGYQRIAEQISLVFDVEIDKDLVRRVLAKHYKPEPGSNGPSWLTFLGHSRDSLWSVDLFRCESLILLGANYKSCPSSSKWSKFRCGPSPKDKIQHALQFAFPNTPPLFGGLKTWGIWPMFHLRAVG